MKKNIGNALALYPTPLVVVGAMVDGKPNWLLVAYEGNTIRAIFDKGLQRRTNLLTGQAEDVADYAGCSKLWFIIYD